MYSDYNRNQASDKAPDYLFWVERDFWKLPEAAKLLCGRDPMARFTGRPRYNTNWRVIDIIDKAFEAVQAGDLSGDRSALLPVHVMVTPEDFLKWAQSKNFEIPGQLRKTAGLPPGEPESSSFDQQQSDAGHFNESLVLTVARTLRLACPELSPHQIARHQAMTVVGGITGDAQDEVIKFLESQSLK